MYAHRDKVSKLVANYNRVDNFLVASLKLTNSKDTFHVQNPRCALCIKHSLVFHHNFSPKQTTQVSKRNKHITKLIQF